MTQGLRLALKDLVDQMAPTGADREAGDRAVAAVVADLAAASADAAAVAERVAPVGKVGQTRPASGRWTRCVIC